MIGEDPLQRATALYQEISLCQPDADFLERFKTLIDEFSLFSFFQPEMWVAFTEKLAQIFSHLLMSLPQIQEDPLRQEIFLIFETTIHTLSLREDWLYRDGQSNDALRSLLFLLTKDAGHTPVPTGEGLLSVLDHRYNGQMATDQAKKGQIKVGEIAESQAALHIFKSRKNDRHALDALVELGDVFFNLIKLTQDRKLGLTLSQLFAAVLSDIPPNKKDRLVELFFELCNVAIWKFWFRYVQHEGEKNPLAESKELGKKWHTSTKNGSPSEFLGTHLDDCEKLLQSVIIYCEKLLGNEMQRLGLSQEDQKLIREKMINVSNYFQD